MGQGSLKKPEKLAAKLLELRNRLGLSQVEMIKAMDLDGEVKQSQISAFERGTRTPSLLILLKYARLAQISTDILIDDDAQLS